MPKFLTRARERQGVTKAAPRRAPELDPEILARRAALPDIARRVRERYLPQLPTLRREREPLNGLIETILSQQNTAPITRRQFAALRAAFRTWESALASGPDAIADTLRAAGGGLARVKADYIWNLLYALSERGETLGLADLHADSDAQARARLEELPGVGPKTASCVLLFSMLRPAMPVDTHIHRITRRLGLVPETWSAPRTEAWYDGELPRTWEDRYAFHVSMIRHGRETCRAPKPRCGECVLNGLCPSAALFELK